MSGDLAVLGMRFETENAETANRQLDQITEKSERAEKATDSLSGSQKRAGTATGNMEAEIAKAVKTQEEAIKHMKDLGGAAGRMAGDVATGNASLENLSSNGTKVAESLFAIGGRAALVGGAVAGLTGLVLTGAMAWLDYDRATRAAENALGGIGRQTGLSVKDFQDLAAAAADAGGLSIKQAEGIAASYVRMGIQSGPEIQKVTALTRDYAAAAGIDLKNAQSELTEAMSGTERGLEAVESRIGTLDPATRAHVKTLRDHGLLTESNIILLDKLAGSVRGTADNVDVLAGAWNGAAKAVSNYWGALGKNINLALGGGQPEDRLEFLTQQSRFGPNPAIDNEIARTRALIDQKAASDAAGAAEARRNKTIEDGRKATEALLPWETRRAQKLTEIRQIQDAQRVTGLSTPEQAAALRAAQVQLKQIDELAARDGAPRPRKGRTGPSAEERHAASLARELEAMRATAQANRDLAAAYGESDAAGLKAAARAEVVGRAVKRQGDIDAFVAAQLQVNASKATAEAARTVADLNKTTEGRERMNAAMAAGTITADQANDALALEAELRPLIAYAATVEGDAKRDLQKQIEALTAARLKDNAAARAAQIIAANQQDRNQLGVLGLQSGMVGASDLAQAVAMARLARTQQLGQDADTPAGKAAIQLAEDMAAAQVRLNQQQTAYNLGLEYQLNLTRQIDDASRAAADGMAGAFGTAGKAMGDVMTGLSGYRAQIASIDKAQKDYQRSVGEFQDPAQNKLFDDQRAQAAIQGYGDMLSAAKGYFQEGSDGYKVMHAAEMAYRAYQFAVSIQAMALNAAETGSVLATSGIKAGAYLAEGAAKMFAMLGPFAFPAVAAMVAVLASLGLKGKGGSGGGYSPANDNVDASVSTVQGYAAADERARDSAAQAVASRVEVVVTADRNGMNAFVVGTAQREAASVAIPMAASAAGYAKQDTLKELNNRQAGNRKVVT